MALQWSDDYKLGIKVIDNDHEGLFEAVNSLQGHVEAGATEHSILEDLDFFARYVREHFDREELILKQYEYPNFHEHMLQHRNIRRSVFAIRKLYADDPQVIDAEKMTGFFSGWLRNHILKDDMAYLPFIGVNFGRRKSDNPSKKPSKRERQVNETQEDLDDLVPVTLNVPREARDVIGRCAAILRLGSIDAEELRQFVVPLYGMTSEEMVRYAGIVMKKEKKDEPQSN